jgi:hypothetical protein
MGTRMRCQCGEVILTVAQRHLRIVGAIAIHLWVTESSRCVHIPNLDCPLLLSAPLIRKRFGSPSRHLRASKPNNQGANIA